jgi:fumarate hydratase, class II
MGQSSNDVIPTAIHVSAALEIHAVMLPALEHLAGVIEAKAQECHDVVKTGRTHLMDAMPVRMSQELGGWATQLRLGIERVQGQRCRACPAWRRAARRSAPASTPTRSSVLRFAAQLAERTGISFRASDDYFESLSCQDTAVELSGQLKTVAVSLMKIANDLRWMNSGPLAGLGEIALPALQPGLEHHAGQGESGDPGGHRHGRGAGDRQRLTITIGGQSGNFQLNVMLPVIADRLLDSIRLIGAVARALADRAIRGFTVNEAQIRGALDRNPILVTALNPVIGYELGAATAKKAYAEGRPIREVALDMTELSEEELARLLDPAGLTEGGIRK